MFRLLSGILLLAIFAHAATAQPSRWQQRVNYQMAIDFDVKKHQFTGNQVLTYYNNSPDTLNRVFYHLYFNAFQPGSAMDVRSRTISDADPRVGERIAALKPDEIGYLRVTNLTQAGQELTHHTEGTILEVTLAQPLLPGDSTVFVMDFKGQVPLQIRRSGRDNAEGISYSMAQWYPKLCEYDNQGWHPNPYVGREFYGVWGDFDVRITIDKGYLVGGTGYLQNPDQTDAPYTGALSAGNNRHKQTYHFVAPNVHDFMWAADPDYQHTTLTRTDGVVLHCFFQPSERNAENWEALPRIMDRAFDFINQRYGRYPYQQYSFIQGGDGGMEYPMATLITGERNLVSLVGVSVHELMHSWYQMVLGTNESLYSWMDEGFTSYASAEVMNYLRREGLIPGDAVADPHAGSMMSHVGFNRSGRAEPLSIHADHFQTNAGYGVASYVTGEVFLHQLSYIIGQDAFDQGMLRYFHDWKFRHPNDHDFVRIMERVSGLELDWYREYMVNTTHLSDYGIATVTGEANTTQVGLQRLLPMPMPIDVVVTLTDNTEMHYTIPLDLMRGAKTRDGNQTLEVAPDWTWTHPDYILQVAAPLAKIKQIAIDPSGRLVDANKSNNTWVANP